MITRSIQEPFNMQNKGAYNYISKGGEDTIYLNMTVEFGDKFATLCDELNRLKNLAQGKTDSPDAEDSPDTLENVDFDFDENYAAPPHDDTNRLITDNHAFTIAPHGMNPGNSRFSNYQFVLAEFGIRYLIANRNADKTSASGNVYIMVGSCALIKWGLTLCRKIITSAIADLGGKIIETTVSRVDYCVDLANMSVDAFQSAFEKKLFVCKARKHKEYFLNDGNPDTESFVQLFGSTKHKTGITIGKSNIICRIYDKIEEVKRDPVKALLLEQNRFGGEMPETATRVEFEIKRNGLRNLSFNNGEVIRTLDDYLKHRGSIINYLVKNWLRIYELNIDRHHTDRLTYDNMLDQWKIVVDTFCECVKQHNEAVKFHVSDKKPDETALAKQSFGCLTSFIAAQNLPFDCQKTIMQHFGTILKDTFRVYSWAEIQKRIRKKICDFNADNPALEQMQFSGDSRLCC